MSIRAKKVFIDLIHLLQVNENENPQAPMNEGDGGATMYRGGQTAYEAGKTPMPLNTPQPYEEGGNPEYQTYEPPKYGEYNY
jgi:hypothetical protein